MKRYFGFLSLLCVALTFPSSGFAEYDTDVPFCGAGMKPARVPVILGRVKYILPSELEPSVQGMNDRGIMLPRCVPETAPDVYAIDPYKIRDFAIQAHSFKKYADKYKMLPILLHIRGENKASYHVKDDFCKLKKELQGRTVSEVSYKEDPQFTVITETLDAKRNPPIYTTYLYSEKYRFHGMPILMRCENLDPAKSTKASSDCGYVGPISDTTSIYLRLTLLNVPGNKIGEMFKDVEGFLSAVNVDPLPETEFSSCEPTQAKEK